MGVHPHTSEQTKKNNKKWQMEFACWASKTRTTENDKGELLLAFSDAIGIGDSNRAIIMADKRGMDILEGNMWAHWTWRQILAMLIDGHKVFRKICGEWIWWLRRLRSNPQLMLLHENSKWVERWGRHFSKKCNAIIWFGLGNSSSLQFSFCYICIFAPSSKFLDRLFVQFSFLNRIH